MGHPGSVNIHISVKMDRWTADDDAPLLVLVIVVGAALINVSAASVLLRLAWRHTAIAPASLLAATPSWWTPILVAVSAVLVPVAPFPALVIVKISGTRFISTSARFGPGNLPALRARCRPAFVRSEMLIRSCSASVAIIEITTSHDPARIEEWLHEAAPRHTPAIEAFEIGQGFAYSLAGQAIQLPEQQNVELPLTRCQHHGIELNAILLAGTAHCVNELSNNLPPLRGCKLA
jgi:hypothetical protein